MPRLSPSELRAAKQRKAEEEAMAQRRRAASQAIVEELKLRHDQLSSVVATLYTEIDKLNRKWPTQQVSQLTLDKVNKAIRAVRELMKDESDDFVEDITEIFPAGDLPENRDVALILGQLGAALARMKHKYQREWLHL
jgi:hypothetical protein